MEAGLGARVGGNNNTLIFKDESTANYGGETITARNIQIEFPDGNTEVLNFPIVSGVGDEISYTFLKPYALKITLILTPSVVVTTSDYQDLRTVAMLTKYDELRKDKEDNLLYNVDVRNVLTMPRNLLRDLEWIVRLISSAATYTTAGEILEAQECIDGLENIYNIQ
jgi:hypothetical protein